MHIPYGNMMATDVRIYLLKIGWLGVPKYVEKSFLYSFVIILLSAIAHHGM